MDEQNYLAAIDILQLGLETLDDEALEEMLDEVITLQLSETAEMNSDYYEEESSQEEYDPTYDNESYNQEYLYQEPVSNTYTASTILANLGMTEQEFRDSCQPLALSGVYKEMLTATALKEYPSMYVGQHFFFSTDWHDSDIPGYHTPASMVVDWKSMSNDGYTTYHNFPTNHSFEYILLFDCRDDIYSPTISEGEGIYAYMIFLGVQTINGTDHVCFQLISADK